MRPRLSLVSGIGLILAAALATAAPPASALPGPASLSTGFDADTLSRDAPQAGPWFSRMAQLGSSWVRISATWSDIAPKSRPPRFDAANPGDPHYDWAFLDSMVRNAAAAHQRILLMLTSAPAWALGRGAPRNAFPRTWRPSANEYGAFARAVARRYSGRFPDPLSGGHALPRVSDFQAWNEPNLPTSLEPQWARTRAGFVAASPAIYRGLLNALYGAVKSVQPHAYVLAAGLAPYGDNPGTFRMRPVTFLRGLLCLDGSLRAARCPRPAHFDAIDVHPYSVTPTKHAFNADDVSILDIARLARVLGAAERTGRALPGGPKPIWMTEIDWDSAPDPGGLPLTQQAQYLARAFYELWRQGVRHVMWYEPHDLGGTPRGAVPYGGLFFTPGGAKPSALAFRFPFVALRGRGGITTLWGRAPGAGAVTVEVARGNGWQRVARLATTRGGVFYARRRLGARLTLRARSGAAVSYPWPTG